MEAVGGGISVINVAFMCILICGSTHGMIKLLNVVKYILLTSLGYPNVLSSLARTRHWKPIGSRHSASSVNLWHE